MDRFFVQIYSIKDRIYLKIKRFKSVHILDKNAYKKSVLRGQISLKIFVKAGNKQKFKELSQREDKIHFKV